MMGMICLPIIISAFILLFRKVEKPAARYLAFFLIAAVLAVGPQIIGYAGFYDKWPGLTYFPLFSTELWLGPLIYLHADRLMRGGLLGWRKFLFVPGIIQFFYYVWAFFGLGDYKAKWAYNKSFHSPYIDPIENILTIALMLLAMYLIWRLVGRYKTYLENTSSAAIDENPTWLRNLVLGLLIAGSCFAGLEFMQTIRDISYNSAFPFQVMMMLFIAWIAIDACWRLTRPFPKQAIDQLPDPQPDSNHTQASGLNAPEIKTRILSENWHLEPRISIRDLAARLGTNETYLSRTLNRGAGQSFNRFINEIRVDHAKDLLGKSGANILTVAFDSGFNSKATFNRVFKTVTGQTPSQFKTSQNP